MVSKIGTSPIFHDFSISSKNHQVELYQFCGGSPDSERWRPAPYSNALQSTGSMSDIVPAAAEQSTSLARTGFKWI
jgi:hypothetical protein